MMRPRRTYLIARILSASAAMLFCVSMLVAVTGRPATAQEQCQACLNDHVRDALRDNGDDGRASRQVVHFAYPEVRGAKSRRAVIRFLEGQGFAVSSLKDGGVAFEHESPVARGAFDELTQRLFATLANAG